MPTDTQGGLALIYSDLRKTFLPNRSAKTEFASCAKFETTLNQLNGLLHRHPGTYRDQCMEMVGHDHKFMKTIFSLLAIVIQHVDQQAGCTG